MTCSKCDDKACYCVNITTITETIDLIKEEVIEHNDGTEETFYCRQCAEEEYIIN